MKAAIEEYQELRESGMKPNMRMLARAWNIPKTTLHRRLSGKVTGHSHMIGRKPLLSQDSELKLVELIKLLASRGFPMRRVDIQKLVYKFAQLNHIPGFSETREQAGQYWMDNFLRRHQSVSLRKPEGLSASRAGCLNEITITKWFNLYENLLRTLGIHDLPSHIWNMDETGLQDHFLTSKVVAEKGQPCFQITSGEKGETTTALACFNAAGEYGPLMVIFKAKRVKCEWSYDIPPKTILRATEKGWIASDILVDWGQYFVSNLPKEDARPHVLLLDGHSSHVYNLAFLQLMKASNVHVMCYPPHVTHKLQPADKSLFKSLKSHWTEEGRKFIRQTGGGKLPKSQFFTVFRRAWEKAATVKTAQAGFRATGMFPVDMQVLGTRIFEPSLTSERPLSEWVGSEVEVGEEANNTQEENDGVFIPLIEDPQDVEMERVLPTPTSLLPHSSLTMPQATECTTTPVKEVDAGSVSMADLVTLPHRKRGPTRKRSKPPSFLLTSSDHFNYMMKTKKNKSGRKAVNQTKAKPGTSKEGNDVCLACKFRYGSVNDPKKTEEWVKCSLCEGWYHQTCAEDNGIIDDASFNCRDCLFGEEP